MRQLLNYLAVKVREDRNRGIISEGCEKAREVAGMTLADVKQAIGLAYR